MIVALARLPSLLACSLVAGCGYLSSGTWEDDAENLERAWGIESLPSTEVVHSWYSRSPHFTREEKYYFQFRGPAELAPAIAFHNEMKRRENSTSDQIRALPWDADRPAWFVPKAADSYEVWALEGAGQGFVFRRIGASDVFVYVCQL